MKTNGIRIKKVDTHPDRPWLVSVAPSVFGKQICKRFATQKDAKAQAHSYMMKAASKEREPLDPDIHRVVALFRNKLSATQIMTALTTAVELQGLALFTLEELANEYLEHQGMLQERGSISSGHLKDAKHLALTNNKLTEVTGLEKLTKLRELELRHNPDLTKAQIDELQKALPKCKIHSDPTK